MGCFSGHLMSAASDQKLLCKLCSPFCCSFDEFVEEKVISPSYSSAILTPPPLQSEEVFKKWLLLQIFLRVFINIFIISSFIKNSPPWKVYVKCINCYFNCNNINWFYKGWWCHSVVERGIHWHYFLML